ncbi:hypothetical protein, partial [Paenibacillus sp. CGMCC 1.18879]|uniref:hypothetical protein n=1 Tax=Paenibacillus sp. CGMCC 1.18879 TaxID=2834466 RepID=UPI001CA97115
SGTLLTFWNRRMRTRMYGGVRGRGLAAPSYSIHKLDVGQSEEELQGEENLLTTLSKTNKMTV